MKFFSVSLFTALVLMSQSHAATLVVDPREKAAGAYGTIQSAVDSAKPGDVVEIRGGVYFERVDVKRGGEPGRPITIQGAPDSLVVINAGRRLDGDLKPVKDLAEVYSADVPAALIGEKFGIWEMPSRLRLARVQTAEQVAGRLGSWFYDAREGKLYLRSTGERQADRAAYWIESGDQPAVRVKASYVHLRNLQATLGQHGFLVELKTSHVTIEGCRAFCNSWAGIHVTGDDHLIAHNETFQNNTYGIQLRYGVNRVRVVGNSCLFNGPNNGEATGTSVPTDLGIYSLGENNVFEGNMVEGLHEDVYRNKTGHGASPANLLRNNVIKGNQTPGPYGVYNNTLLVGGLGMREGMYRNGGPASEMRSWDLVDPAGLQRAWNLIYPLVQKEEPRFADTAYRDYRLQADSPYYGMGAFPGREPVFYVDPEKGSDANTGLGLKTAFATVQAALKHACAGATLYLLPGNYSDPIVLQGLGGINSEEPFRIRAHGKSPNVKITGSLRIKNAQNLQIEGIEFGAPLELENARGVSATECLFVGKTAGLRAKGCRELKVDRCTFVENNEALDLGDSAGTRITQNLFVRCSTALAARGADSKAFFCDFNAYDRFAAKMGEQSWNDLEQWRTATGQDSQSALAPINLGAEFALPSSDPLAMRAADFGSLGARVERAESRVEIRNLKVAGLGPHGATLLWDSPRQPTFAEITLTTDDGARVRSWEPAYMLQVMAASFDFNQFSPAFYASERHAGTGDLKPDTVYRATVVARDALGNRSQPTSVTFRTPAGYAAPAQYYVSPSGSDSADGKSPQAAWRSFSHATSRLAPGDELILLPGVYRETLRPRVSGTEERRITIRAQKPGEAVLDLAKSLPLAVEILNVDFITVDGLLIKDGFFPFTNCYVINHARGITVRDGEVDYPSVANFQSLKLGYGGLVAHQAPDLKVENNLFLCCVYGVAASNSPGALIQGNTFVGEGNYGVVIIPGGAEESYTVQDNLFYRAILGYKTGPCLWVFKPMPKLVSNHNLFFIPPEHKGTIGELPGSDRIAPLAAWQKETGLDKDSIEAEPQFVDPSARNFRLKPSSPGAKVAADGGPVGFRN